MNTSQVVRAVDDAYIVMDKLADYDTPAARRWITKLSDVIDSVRDCFLPQVEPGRVYAVQRLNWVLGECEEQIRELDELAQEIEQTWPDSISSVLAPKLREAANELKTYGTQNLDSHREQEFYDID